VVKKSAAKPILLAMVMILCAWFLTAGAVYGATMFQKMMTVSANIVKEADFKFYSDDDAEHEITNIVMGDIVAGETFRFTIYVKNTSTTTEVISMGPATVPSTLGTLTMTFNGQQQVTLAPGAIAIVVGTLNVGEDATAGPIDFNFSVQALAVSSSISTTTATTSTPVNTTATTPTTVALNGQQIYAANCASCHSSPPNTALSQSQLASFISGHRSGSSLTSAQVAAVAAYIKP
jgi:activator of HSP90 ATPase